MSYVKPDREAQMSRPLFFNPRMSKEQEMKDVLADNLGRITGQSIRSWASKGGEPTNASLALGKLAERIKGKKGSPSVSSLCEIARRAGGIEPWHLLIPNLNPANPPQIADMVTGVFSVEVMEAVSKLDDTTRRIHENSLRIHLGLEPIPAPVAAPAPSEPKRSSRKHRAA